MASAKRLGRPRGSSREDTLARIMPEARHLFANKGYAQTTFKDVGKAVGMSHAALYAYFASKKELYLETLQQTQALLIPHFAMAFEQGSTLRERLSLLLMAIANEHDKDPSITGFLAAVPIEIRRHEELFEVLVDNNNAAMQMLETMFEEARANGEITLDVPASELVAALFGGGVGVALFQYGMHKPDLSSTMAVFVALIEARIFAN